MQLSAGKQGGRCKIGPLAGRQAANDVGQVMGVALHQALLCQVSSAVQQRAPQCRLSCRSQVAGRCTAHLSSADRNILLF